MAKISNTEWLKRGSRVRDAWELHKAVLKVYEDHKTSNIKVWPELLKLQKKHEKLNSRKRFKIGNIRQGLKKGYSRLWYNKIKGYEESIAKALISFISSIIRSNKYTINPSTANALSNVIKNQGEQEKISWDKKIDDIVSQKDNIMLIANEFHNVIRNDNKVQQPKLVHTVDNKQDKRGTRQQVQVAVTQSATEDDEKESITDDSSPANVNEANVSEAKEKISGTQKVDHLVTNQDSKDYTKVFWKNDDNQINCSTIATANLNSYRTRANFGKAVFYTQPPERKYIAINKESKEDKKEQETNFGEIANDFLETAGIPGLSKCKLSDEALEHISKNIDEEYLNEERERIVTAIQQAFKKEYEALRKKYRKRKKNTVPTTKREFITQEFRTLFAVQKEEYVDYINPYRWKSLNKLEKLKESIKFAKELHLETSEYLLPALMEKYMVNIPHMKPAEKMRTAVATFYRIAGVQLDDEILETFEKDVATWFSVKNMKRLAKASLREASRILSGVCVYYLAAAALCFSNSKLPDTPVKAALLASSLLAGIVPRMVGEYGINIVKRELDSLTDDYPNKTYDIKKEIPEEIVMAAKERISRHENSNLLNHILDWQIKWPGKLAQIGGGALAASFCLYEVMIRYGGEYISNMVATNAGPYIDSASDIAHIRSDMKDKLCIMAAVAVLAYQLPQLLHNLPKTVKRAFKRSGR